VIDAGEVLSAIVARGYLPSVTADLLLPELREAEHTEDWPLLRSILTDFHERLLHDAGL
jgi:hypothetical protein